MTGKEAADAFVAKYNGQYIDEDRYYGSQCWDVSARYAREMWNCPYFPTGSGGAEGLWRLFQWPIPDYFSRVPNAELQPGDIAVWDATFYPPYGHTALVWRRDGNTIFVLEQDGSKDPNGDGNADGISYIAQRIITNKLSGGLRPKAAGGSNMTASEAIVDDTFIRLVVSLGEYREATQADLNTHRGQPGAALLQTFINAPRHADQQFKIADYDRLANEFAQYKKDNPPGSSDGEFVETKVYIKKS